MSHSCIVSKPLKISSNIFWIKKPIISIFWNPRAVTKFQRVSPQPLNIRGGENVLFSTEIAVYLENGTRWTNGCYGTLTGRHGQPIDSMTLSDLEKGDARVKSFRKDLLHYACTI